MSVQQSANRNNLYQITNLGSFLFARNRYNTCVNYPLFHGGRGTPDAMKTRTARDLAGDLPVGTIMPENRLKELEKALSSLT